MKLTTARLKKLIREELNKVNESKGDIHYVMNLFMKHEVDDAIRSAIDYGVADEVLQELMRLERESMDLGQANQFSLYIDKLRFAMSKKPKASFGGDDKEGPDLSDYI